MHDANVEAWTARGAGSRSALVRAAQEMGGTLTADSGGPGRGAVFTLELPLQTAGATDPGHSP